MNEKVKAKPRGDLNGFPAKVIFKMFVKRYNRPQAMLSIPLFYTGNTRMCVLFTPLPHGLLFKPTCASLSNLDTAYTSFREAYTSIDHSQ